MKQSLNQQNYILFRISRSSVVFVHDENRWFFLTNIHSYTCTHVRPPCSGWFSRKTGKSPASSPPQPPPPASSFLYVYKKSSCALLPTEQMIPVVVHRSTLLTPLAVPAGVPFFNPARTHGFFFFFPQRRRCCHAGLGTSLAAFCRRNT